MDKFRVFYLLGRVFSFFILVSFIATIIFAVFPRQIRRSDFVSFYAAAEILKNGEGNNLYDFDTQTLYQKQVVAPDSREGVLPFRNPSLLAAIFIPLTLFPLEISYKIYGLFLIGVLLLEIFLSRKLFRNIPSFLLPIIFLLYFANIITIFWGQTTVLFLLIFLYLLKLLKERNYYCLGLVAGLLSLKPQYLLFIPFLFFLVDNKKKFLQGFFMTFLVVFFASFLISGPSLLLKYPTFLIQTEDVSFGSRPWQMITFYYLLFPLLNFVSISKVIILGLNTLLYGAALSLFIQKKRRFMPDMAFSVALILTVPLMLHAQIHDTSLVLISILGILNHSLKIIPIVLFTLPIFLLGFFGKGMELAALIYLFLGIFSLKPTVFKKLI